MPYQVKLEKFEGPMNLLLSLIEEQKLDINELSIAKVADDYLEYIRQDDEISLENLAEFVNIASKIILIKSRSILPTLDVSPIEEKEIKDLEEQLKLYKKYKDAAKNLADIIALKRHMFSREYMSGLAAVFLPPPKLSTTDLQKQYLELARQIVLPEKLAEEAVNGIVTLEEKIAELQNELRQKIEMSFSDLKGGAGDKVDIIVSFLALLELVKQKFVQVEQNSLFEEIRIKNINSNV